MTRDPDRRWFLHEFGKGAFGLVVLGGLAACGDGTGSEPTITLPESVTLPPSSTTTQAPSTSASAGGDGTAAPTTTGADAPPQLGVARINLGFVSAYVAVVGPEVLVVDTGQSGSQDQIESGLSQLGFGWADVGAVVLTHRHGDHVGSLGAIADAASAADIFAGAADIDAITSPRPMIAVGNGDAVATMDVIEVPGHTPGSIALHDAAARVLIVGDTLNGAGAGPGPLSGPNERFSTDHAQAIESARLLSQIDVDAVYMGHGEPVVGGAAAALQAMAAEL